MSISQGPKIYAGMLKRELLEIADRLGLRGVSKLKKEELIEVIQASLRRSRRAESAAGSKASGSPRKPATPPRDRPSATPPAKAAPAKLEAAAKRPEASSKPDALSMRPSESPRPNNGAPLSEQSRVVAAKYRVGTPYAEDDLRGVDEHLPGLPEGYGIDRLVLLPRDPAWMYAYWDIKNETKEEARARGGQNLAIRLYEDTDDGLEPMAEHWCQELARSWYLQVPAPGRTYVAEIGYRASNGSWLGLLRSNAVQVPPAGPSPLVADEFVTLDPMIELPGRRRGRKVGRATAKGRGAEASREASRRAEGLHEASYQASVGGAGATSMGSAGFGGALPGGVSSAGLPSSPAGFGGSPAGGPAWGGAAPAEAGAFWLVADAELIVFGATEPDARLTVGDRMVKLRPDGTFSLRMTFPDGVIDVPIVARSADGKHERSLALRFERSTGRGQDSDQQ